MVETIPLLELVHAGDYVVFRKLLLARQSSQTRIFRKVRPWSFRLLGLQTSPQLGHAPIFHGKALGGMRTRGRSRGRVSLLGHSKAPQSRPPIVRVGAAFQTITGFPRGCVCPCVSRRDFSIDSPWSTYNFPVPIHSSWYNLFEKSVFRVVIRSFDISLFFRSSFSFPFCSCGLSSLKIEIQVSSKTNCNTIFT